MASISKENGRWRIQFKNAESKRKTLRLGKVSKRFAETDKLRVEHLLASAVAGIAWDAETSRWVAELSGDLAEKMAAVGLIPKRGSKPVTTIGPFLDSYIQGRPGIKPNTRRNYEVTKQHLTDFFGTDKPLEEITAGDADEWRDNLFHKDLSLATVSRETKRAKQFFRVAVRKELIKANPFTDLPSPAQANSSGDHFVSVEITNKVIDACPDAEWRLIVALSRFGGLRCPSEHLKLRWGDVDWANGRLTVRSPKTEHHPGGESRVIPLFPDLRTHLEVAFDQAGAGSEFVITRYRDQSTNLRTQLKRIIKRAGVKAWPNCSTTCERVARLS